MCEDCSNSIAGYVGHVGDAFLSPFGAFADPLCVSLRIYVVAVVLAVNLNFWLSTYARADISFYIQ